MARDSVICPICLNQDNKIIWKEGKYQAYQCRRCKVVYISPCLNDEEIKQIYSQTYFQTYYEPCLPAQLEYFRQILAEIEKWVKRGRVLDVGCGLGAFLKAAGERGWKINGLEISPYAADVAGRELGKNNIYNKKLTEANLPTKSYDLISMWDTLGHVTEPRLYLLEINCILKKDGLLVIKVPNHFYSLFKLAGFVSSITESKGILHVPAQLYHFTPESMESILNYFGYTIIKTIKNRFRASSIPLSRSRLKSNLMIAFMKTMNLLNVPDNFVILAKRAL